MVPPRYCAGNMTQLLTSAGGQLPQSLPHPSPGEKSPYGGQTLKNIQNQGVHMPADLTGRSVDPHLFVWFRLLLAGLISLLLLLPIASGCHPLQTACSCHSVCCPPPVHCKSLWHESIKTTIVFLNIAIYSFMLWACQIIFPSVFSIIH